MKTPMLKLSLSFLLFSSVSTLFGSPVQANVDSFSVQKLTHPAEIEFKNTRDWYQLDTKNLEGTSTQIDFVLTNPSTESKTITIEARNALAQTNQLLDVTYPNEESDIYSLITEPSRVFKKYTPNFPKEIVVPAQSEKTISLPVNVPNFTGEILGGFAFKELDANTEKLNKDENVSTAVTVQQEYVIAVHLVSDTPLKEELFFNNAVAVSNPTQFSIRFEVENPNPNLFTTPVSYAVVNSNGETIFQNEDPINFKMPPNSKTYYEIPWNQAEIQKGEYTLFINDKKLPFNIEEQAIDKAKLELNPEKTIIVEDKGWLLPLAIIIMVINLFFFAFFFLRRNKNKSI